MYFFFSLIIALISMPVSSNTWDNPLLYLLSFMNDEENGLEEIISLICFTVDTEFINSNASYMT